MGVVGSRLWSGLEGGGFFDLKMRWNRQVFCLLWIGGWICIMYTREGGIEWKKFSPIFGGTGIFALSLQSQTKRGVQETDKMMNEKKYFGSFGSLRKSITFAVAKETGDPPATESRLTTAIFEIIDIDKQKCSNKRLGNERPNRQLRTFT